MNLPRYQTGHMLQDQHQLLSHPLLQEIHHIQSTHASGIVLKDSKLEFFILLSLLYVLSAVIVNEYIIRDELYYRSHSKKG